MFPTGQQSAAQLSLQVLKGLNERKLYANEDNGEFDILRNATFDRANAITKINGIKLLMSGFNSPIINIIQTNDSRRNIIIQCQDSVRIITEGELFGTPYTPNIQYQSINEEETMPIAILNHTTASGTGGGAVGVTLAQRPINHIVSQLNADGTAAAFVTLAANQFTLAPGVYRIRGWMMASHATAGKKCWGCLYDVTAGANAWVGQENEFTNTIIVRDANDNFPLQFSGVVQPGAPNIYELRQASDTSSPSGLGFAAGITGVKETFVYLEIIKTA